MTVVNSKNQVLPPPSERPTVFGWVVKNLFRTWYNALLTIVTLTLIFLVLRGMAVWMVSDGRWEVISANMRLYMVGQYPSMIEGQTDYIWRIWLVVYLLAATIGLSWGAWVKKREFVGWVLLSLPVIIILLPFIVNLAFKVIGWFSNVAEPYQFPPFTLNASLHLLVIDVVALVSLWIGKRFSERLKRPAMILGMLYFPLAILIINGFGPEDSGSFFATIPTRFWGGLLLSLILAVVGIVFSFPIGVLLALGRQSKLPVMRSFSVIYIEFIRGVPMISLLFMGQVMLPLFLPEGIQLDRVLRAMAAIIMFAAAYMAENVRGGLQAIPRGQYEAAHAIGLSGFQTLVFIILPQALRTVIPVLVGQFIGLFKDTTLVSIVGLLDLLGIARGIIANPKFIGTQREVFLFISIFYFVFSYGMSYASKRLESALGVGER